MILAPFTLKKTPIYVSHFASSVLLLSASAARTEGVAPLAVFFDATETISSSTSNPFHEILYLWDFGDTLGSPVNGTDWTTGNQSIKSRNIGFGACAGHVFERPGTYTVTLQASDGISVATTTFTITVTDPDSVFSGNNTICVSADTLPVEGENGVPTGAVCVVNASFPSIVNTYCLTGKRVLLKRGDTFNNTEGKAVLSHTGPGILGAYGSGSKPLVQYTKTPVSDPLLSISNYTTPDFWDWRLMDLDFDGMGTASNQGFGHSGYSGGHHQTTVLRCTFRRLGTSLGCSSEIPNYWNNNSAIKTHTVDQYAVVDCISIPDAFTQYTGYNAGNRVMFMGNNFDNGSNAAGSHVLRFPSLRKAVICNNTLLRPGNDRLHLKIHAPIWTAQVGNGGVPNTALNYSPAMDFNGYSEQISVYGNYLSGTNPWYCSFGPQNGGNEEPVRNLVCEMNHFVGSPTSQLAIQAHCQNLTVRNNLYEGNSTVSMVLTQVGVFGVETPANNIRVYNNSMYSNATLDGLMAFTQVGDARNSNVVTSNNLGYAPNTVNPVAFTTGGAAGISGTNNSTTTQMKGTNPFTTVPPVTEADWTPTGYAIGGGVSVPVRTDYAGVSRTDPFDIGAYQH